MAILQKFKLAFKLCAILCFSLLGGCAYTSEGQLLQPIELAPSANPPRVEYTVGDFSFSLDGGKMVSSSFVGSALNKKIMDEWKARHLVSDAQEVDNAAFTGQADYNIILSGTEYGESSIGMQILSGATLFLIPCSVTLHYDLQYLLVDNKTGKKYSASIQEMNEVDHELFLIFALPFSQDGQDEMLGRVGDHLYDQLAKQGAFKKLSSKSKMP